MSNFDDIRPYTDAELPAALARIADWSQFAQVARYIYPDRSDTDNRAALLAIRSVRELQTTFMLSAIRRLVANTTSGFTVSGLSHLRPDGAYLFVSNHRDITLDAFLLQMSLLDRDRDTSHIIFGNNLIASPVIGDMFRVNKLVQMDRGGSPRAFYQSLHHLSEYINRLVCDEGHSVWIAQRNGRAKDGVDATQPAMVKMLALGSGKPPVRALADLHLVPLSISYEWDPCDLMKANELFLTRHGGYRKAEGEDLNSVVTGIIGDKGKVHLTVGRPLTLQELTPPDGTDYADHVAALLDSHIQSAYRLMPTNYAAFDLLDGGRRYRARYSALLQHRLTQRMSQLDGDERRHIFLETYAAPVRSKLRLEQ